MKFTLDRTEFATQRRGAQDALVALLLPEVEAALARLEKGERNWRADLLEAVDAAYERIYDEDLEGSGEGSFTLRRSLRNALGKSTAESDPEVIARWLSTLILSAATEQAARDDEESIDLEWVTMHDGHVREAHEAADGQVRKPGQRYDVGGVKMLRPGDPTAPIELWIQCRCTLRAKRAEAVAASASTCLTTWNGKVVGERFDSSQDADAEEEHTSTCIMAIPANDDPAHSLSMEEAHATVLFFGDLRDIPAGDSAVTLIRNVTEIAARETQPFSAKVTGIEPLGDEGALVWKLDAPELNRLFDDIPDIDTEVRSYYDDATEAGVTRFPDFTAHVTIGYDVPLSGDGVQELSAVEEIRFDRLAVWHRGERTEYPLGGAMPEDTTPEVEQTPPVDDLEGSGLVPWFGVLAPEETWSGDGRMFTEGALTFRDLPIPLGYQKSDIGGHDGAVTVGDIRETWREDGKVWGTGYFLDTEEADELIGMMAHMGRYGVSVDADEAEMELDEDGERRRFTAARVARTTAVAIPAFQEAFIQLGRKPRAEEDVEDPTKAPSEAPPFIPKDEVVKDPEDLPVAPDEEDPKKKGKPFRDVDQAERDRLKDDGKAMPDGSFPIANKDDLGNAIQSVGRAKDQDAAKRHIRKRAKDLGAEDMIPDTWATQVGTADEYLQEPAEFVDVAPGKTEDGPGWLTNPVDTDRLRDYWVRGPGAAKIVWGTPGDFNRCRMNVAEYVKPQHLNGYCANRHYDALGFWPGRAPSEQVALEDIEGAHGDVLGLVASADDVPVYPAEWFEEPAELSIDSGAVNVTEDGRVYGWVAQWGTCHIGYEGICVTPPRSETNYAHFMNKVAHTDKGKVRAGVLTLGTGHAATKLGARPATAHYDNTGVAVADVVVGENETGIWFSGGVRSHANKTAVRDLQSAVISGDWRSIGGSMEMVAALGVNVGGFPVPRTALAASGQEQISLVAAGIVMKQETKTESEIDLLASAVVDVIEKRQERAARLAALRDKDRALRLSALRGKAGV
jgi:hypothetical protein